MSCGFTASTTTSAPRIASAFEVVASTPCRSRELVRPLLAARRDDDVGPARATQPGEQRLADLAGAEDRDPHGASVRVPARYPARRYTLASPAHSPYGREQLVGLLGLDPSAAERRGELHEAEVAGEPALVAAEALEADDADRPRPEAALALEPRARRHRSGGPSAPRGRSSGRARTSVAPRRAPRPARAARPSRSAPGRRRSARRGGRRGRRRGADDAPLVLARTAARGSAGPATARRSACATVAVRRGRRPPGAAVASPRSGSSAKRRRNSEWSSSSPRANRTCSTPASASARTRIDAVDALPCIDALEPPLDGDRRAGRCRRETTRVASLPSRPESRSEYGPRGLSSASITRRSLPRRRIPPRGRHRSVRPDPGRSARRCSGDALYHRRLPAR